MALSRLQVLPPLPCALRLPPLAICQSLGQWRLQSPIMLSHLVLFQLLGLLLELFWIVLLQSALCRSPAQALAQRYLGPMQMAHSQSLACLLLRCA
jgi:hypothetical protein